MSLTKEWRSRLTSWVDELQRNVYRPVMDVDFEGFVTLDQLTPRQAASGSFEPFEVGRRWGAPWQYGWFRTTLVAPAELEGRRVVIKPDLTSAEAAVWCNGEMIESYRGAWPWLTLSRSADAGQRFELLLEAYAWHYPPQCHIGPLSRWRSPGPELKEFNQTVGTSTFGWWDDEAFALLMDVKTLLSLRDAQEQRSLRVARIDEALRQFTRLVDFQADEQTRRAAYAEAREALRPQLEAHNADVAPDLLAFGHSHLDVAWLWPLAETRRKAARTLANQLAMIEQYPGYRFMHSQPHLYRMVKQDYPELYERVRKAVADGTVIADGAAWVEPDTNVSGGEALVRQMMLGKKFFREEFGVDSRHLWLPDVFGYTGALPQILRGCGIESFSTQKIFWNYHSEDTFPYHNFIWEGIDGSELMVHLHHDYNSQTDPGTLINRWRDRVQLDGMSMRMLPFGWGDGGGGPERYHLEYVERLADCQGCPKVRYASPQEFFDELVERGEHDANRWVGELYFAAHRGVLTSQARTKRGNRFSENALREAEMWLSAAAMSGAAYPAEQLDELWKLVLLNQFHDILPGSSIRRVYEEAEADYRRVISEAGELATLAAASLGERAAGSLAIFNSLSWPRRELVALPAGAADATDAEGRALVVQTIGETPYAEVDLPACGWTSITLGEAAPAETPPVVIAEPGRLENELIEVIFNDLGEIESMTDKVTGRELLVGGGNMLRLFRDEPSKFDAWDVDSMIDQCPVDLSDCPAEMTVVSSGPLAGVLEIRRAFSNSTLTQRVTLRRGSRRVSFATSVDWHEKHRMLKVAFAPGIHCDRAIQEIQFGHIQRPTHTNRIPDQDQFEVCNHRYTAVADGGRGLAVLNDCKYGVSIRGGEIGLTLLRSPLGPDELADQGLQEFTYAVCSFDGAFADSDVARQGYELNYRPLTIENLAGGGQLLEIAGDDVILETVKLAEDGSGDLVLRVYESRNRATSCVIGFATDVSRVERTTMLETDGVELPLEDNRVLVELNPFEIATLRVKA